MALTKVHSRMLDRETTVNVKDYYNLTSGGTDWSPAFQQAIDDLATSSDTYTGGVLFVPRGNYPIGSTITVDTTNAAALTSLTIQGEGMHNTVLQCSSGFTGTVALDVTEATYCSFKDFHLFGGNPSNCDNGMRLVEGSEIQIERVFCQRFNDSGFLVQRCFMITMEQCRAKSCLTNFNFASDYGSGGEGYNTSVDCRNCYSLDPLTNGQGFWINDMSYSSFTACASDMKDWDNGVDPATTGRYGYRIGNVGGVSFTSCGNEKSGRAGFYFEASAALDAALINGTRCSLNDCFSWKADTKGDGYGSIFSSNQDIQSFTATAGQTAFTYGFSSPAATSEISVTKQGVLLTETTDYTVNLATQTVTLTSGAALDDVIVIKRTDFALIDVSVRNFKELAVTGAVSVAAQGVSTDHSITFENCDFINSLDGVAAKFSASTSVRENAISITAANTAVLDLKSVFENTNVYSGVLHVIASNGTYAQQSALNTAAYVLLVTKSTAGSGVVEIAKNGLTAGSGASWPSFTWSLDTTNNQLEASPVGSTTGTFFFYVSQIGGMEIS